MGDVWLAYCWGGLCRAMPRTYKFSETKTEGVFLALVNYQGPKL